MEHTQKMPEKRSGAESENGFSELVDWTVLSKYLQEDR